MLSPTLAPTYTTTALLASTTLTGSTTGSTTEQELLAAIAQAESLLDSLIDSAACGCGRLFPRCEDHCPVRHAGTWDPSLPLPEDLSPLSAVQLTAPTTLYDVPLSTGQWIVLRAVPVMSRSDFAVYDALPESIAIIPADVTTATNQLAALLLSSQSGGSGVTPGSLLQPGESVRLGDFSYQRASNSTSSASTSSWLSSQGAAGQQILATIARYRQMAFLLP